MSFKAKAKQKLPVIFKNLAILGQARLQGSSQRPLVMRPLPRPPPDLEEGFCPGDPHLTGVSESTGSEPGRGPGQAPGLCGRGRHCPLWAWGSGKRCRGGIGVGVFPTE